MTKGDGLWLKGFGVPKSIAIGNLRTDLPLDENVKASVELLRPYSPRIIYFCKPNLLRSEQFLEATGFETMTQLGRLFLGSIVSLSQISSPSTIDELLLPAEYCFRGYGNTVDAEKAADYSQIYLGHIFGELEILRFVSVSKARDCRKPAYEVMAHCSMYANLTRN